MSTKQKVKELLKQGCSVKEIGKILNMHPKCITYHSGKIDGFGKRYIKKTNHEFFDVIDSEIKSYLLGYLLADGCVSVEPKKRNGKIYSYTKRITFNVSKDDLYCMKLFQKYVAPESTIKFRQNNKGAKNRKLSCMFRFSSRKIVDVLMEKYKIKPRKTYDVEFMFDFSLIPSQYVRHFIRGFFDGDGCITGTSEKAKNSKISFVVNSIHFGHQLGEILSKELNCQYHILEGKNCYVITISTKTKRNIDSEILTKNLLDYFYLNSNFFLSRKFKRFKFQNKYTGDTEITCKIKKLQVL